MNELIESGDPRAKVVGRCRSVPDTSETRGQRFDQLQTQFNRLWGGLPFRKGVYRFKTWESFDQWKSQSMMRNAPGRR